MKELEDLGHKLDYLELSFAKQLQAIEDDVNEFHKNLLHLATTYPESKDLLEFIVFINDRLNTKQTNFEDILKEIISDLIKFKKELIKHGITINDKVEFMSRRKWYMKLFDKFQQLNLKTSLLVVGSITFIGLAAFYPKEALEVVETLINKFIKGAK